MTDRLTEGLKFVAEELSCSNDEFRRAHHPGGDMLLTALETRGYVNRRGDRIAVSAAGQRRLRELAPAPEAEVE